jgi:ATP-dependent helicase YprA (DUF1998 family)
MQDAYPAANISLRSASPQSYVLQPPRTMDDQSSSALWTVNPRMWMVHPGAIYMHEAQQYFVQELDLENHIAHLVPVGLGLLHRSPTAESEIQMLVGQ